MAAVCTPCWFLDHARCTGWAGDNGMRGTEPCLCDHEITEED